MTGLGANPYPAPKSGCPCCSGQRPIVFHRQESVPGNSCVVFETCEEALQCPTGTLELAVCPDCGFIFNRTFDPALTEYSDRYEESQGFSPTFSSYQKELAQRLVRAHQVFDKKVMEIGCGKGEFLYLLCKAGGNIGLGFDPVYQENRLDLGGVDMTVIRDFYSPRHRAHQADLVCCKMTLEHIAGCGRFVADIAAALKPDQDSRVFIQVPNAKRILAHCAFEDVYNEHCSYFTPGTLARLFQRTGYVVLQVRTVYDDQYLVLEAGMGMTTGADPSWESPKEVVAMTRQYEKRFKDRVENWRVRLKAAARRGRTVLWGSGSKSVAFLSAVGGDHGIEYVVDINPHRQDLYQAGGQKIVAPQFLSTYRPNTVVVMNSVYAEEIRQQIQRMDLAPEVLAL